jgi:hypothetical protein
MIGLQRSSERVNSKNSLVLIFSIAKKTGVCILDLAALYLTLLDVYSAYLLR